MITQYSGDTESPTAIISGCNGCVTGGYPLDIDEKSTYLAAKPNGWSEDVQMPNIRPVMIGEHGYGRGLLNTMMNQWVED